MRNSNFVSVFVVIMLLDSCQKLTMGQNDDGDMFTDVMKDPGMASMVRKMAMSSMAMVQDQDMMFLKAGVDTMDTTSTTAMKAMFTNTKARARQMGEVGRSRNLLLDELSVLFNVPKRQMADSVDKLLNEVGVHEVASRNLGTMDDTCDLSDSIRCDSAAKFRTLDGTCNNLRKPIWGASFIPFRRFLKPAYDDDVSSPRMTSKTGEELPSARSVSLIVHEADRRAPKAAGTSHMLMQWGQFLDHDITSTPISSGAGGSSARCCREDVDGNIDINPEDRDICFPIKLPGNDPQFGRKRCLNFVRSIQIENTECQEAPREQMNQITAFIDGSMVYGSSDDEMRELRTFTGGLLLTSQNDLLPENERPTCLKAKRTDFCFKAGDGRVNEQMGLATLHTVWMREHNRMARELARINPEWGDDTLFQETRKILGAKLQHITYNEFLPIVLSRTFRRLFNIMPNRRGFEDSYNETTDPSIRNGFASAAYRFGHSMVRSMFSQLDHNYRKMEDLKLQSSFGNTSHLIDDDGDGVNRYIRGLVTDNANNIDRFMSPQVTQHLFEDRAGNSLDLAAINIQRGRDHGLPGYNEWRKWCNLPVARTFTRNRGGLINHPSHAVTRLKRIYNHPDDIDLFAGGISERRLRGSLVGPTFSCILAHQFKALKEGDRFWYERDTDDTGFTANQLNVIKQTTLAQVLCDNTDISNMQPNAFKVVSRKNRRRRCEDLTQAALNPWSEDPDIRNSGFGGNDGFSDRNDEISGTDNDSGVFNNGNQNNDNGNNGGLDNADNNGFGNSNDGNDFDNGNDDFSNGNSGFDNGNSGFDFGDGNGDIDDVNGDFDKGNDDFGNGNSDNRNSDIDNGNDDFDNGNGDLDNGNDDVDNGNSDFGNGNSDFENGGNENGDFGNGNSDVRNGNNDFENGNSDFGNGNDNFGNGNSDFRNRNNDFGNENDNFGNRNEGFGNDNNDFRNENSDSGNGNNDFENGNSDFGDGNDNFGNRNDDFGNGNNDFGNENNDFGNENSDFGNGNNDFGNDGNSDFDNRNNGFDDGSDLGNGDSGFNTGNGDFDNVNGGNRNLKLDNNDRSDNGNNGNGDFSGNNGKGSNVISSWGQWTICIRGRNTRRRICPRGTRCLAVSLQHKKCGTNTWSDWSTWSSCNNGQETRWRRCTGLNQSCQGNGFDSRPCASLRSVSWGPWGSWEQCTNSKRWRRRQCSDLRVPNQAACVGPSSESQFCSNSNDCSKSIFKLLHRFLC